MQISDKRTRLIEAADKLVQLQGFSQTTLADIAKKADVPLGNVYYYFKTKEEIAPNSPANTSNCRSPALRGVGCGRAKVAAIARTAATCNTAFAVTPATLEPPSATAKNKKPPTASACHRADPCKSSEGMIDSG